MGENSGTITASYGFGDVIGEENPGVDRSDDADPSVHTPAVLTVETSSANAANRWDETVWDFGTDMLYPVINPITGYDSGSGEFVCEQTMLPAEANCGSPIPGQYDSDGNGAQDTVPAAPNQPTLTQIGSTVMVEWEPALGATAYRVYRSATTGSNELGSVPVAEVSETVYTDTAPLESGRYAISAINDVGEGARSMSENITLIIYRQRQGRPDRYNESGTAEQHTA